MLFRPSGTLFQNFSLKLKKNFREEGIGGEKGVYVFVGILDVLGVLGRCATIDN